VHVLALGLGTGASPYAPGTVGSLVAFPLYFLLMPLPLWLYLASCLVLFILGVWICERTAKDMGVHDHSAIVFDEVVGMLITLALAPAGWVWLVVGFAWFRLFDIWKPLPINLLDKKVTGGFGIMLDDLVAAIYAWLALQGSALLYQAL
jgi:phosphatidylglycerophosphatase A